MSTRKDSRGSGGQDELGLNWDSFKWRNYDYAIGRFMSIDPLAEKYTYNSPYAFQENKLGMGREIEGLEMMPWDQLVTYLAVKVATLRTTGSAAMKSAVGNDGRPSLGGTVSNVSVGGLNVAKVKDLAEVSNKVTKTIITAGRKTANALETTGDNVTVVSAVAAQPEGVAIGQTIGTTGKIMNMGLDKLEGKPVSGIVTDAAPSVVLDMVGGKIVDEVAKNGAVVKEHAEAIISTVQKAVEEKIIDKPLQNQ